MPTFPAIGRAPTAPAPSNGRGSKRPAKRPQGKNIVKRLPLQPPRRTPAPQLIDRAPTAPVARAKPKPKPRPKPRPRAPVAARLSPHVATLPGQRIATRPQLGANERTPALRGPPPGGLTQKPLRPSRADTPFWPPPLSKTPQVERRRPVAASPNGFESPVPSVRPTGYKRAVVWVVLAAAAGIVLAVVTSTGSSEPDTDDHAAVTEQQPPPNVEPTARAIAPPPTAEPTPIPAAAPRNRRAKKQRRRSLAKKRPRAARETPKVSSSPPAAHEPPGKTVRVESNRRQRERLRKPRRTVAVKPTPARRRPRTRRPTATRRSVDRTRRPRATKRSVDPFKRAADPFKRARTKPPREREPEKSSPDAEPGYLTVAASPYATVYIDGRKVGDTPLLRIRLSAGRHRVRGVAADGREARIVVDIPAGGVLRRRLRYRSKQ